LTEQGAHLLHAQSDFATAFVSGIGPDVKVRGVDLVPLGFVGGVGEAWSERHSQQREQGYGELGMVLHEEAACENASTHRRQTVATWLAGVPAGRHDCRRGRRRYSRASHGIELFSTALWLALH